MLEYMETKNCQNYKKDFTKKLEKGFKTAVLATTLVTSTILPKNTEAQNKESEFNDTKKIEIKKQEELEGKRIEYLKYMEDPSYKERLKKEMFGDNYNESSDSLALEEEYKIRKNRIENVIAVILPEGQGIQGDPNTKGLYRNDSIKTDLEHASHELSHASQSEIGPGRGFIEKLQETLPPAQLSVTFQHYGVDKEEITKIEECTNILVKALLDYFKKEQKVNFRFDDGYIKNDMSVDEAMSTTFGDFLMVQPFEPLRALDYLIDFDTTNFKEQIDFLKSIEPKMQNYRDDYRYFKDPREVSARLNSLRIKAIKFGYKINEKFDINKFPKLLEDHQYQELRYFLLLKNEDIQKLMEYVADSGGKELNSNTYFVV